MGLATTAMAQTALPDIDVRRAPVAPLSHHPAAPVKPVVAAPAPAVAPVRSARRVPAPAPVPVVPSAEPTGATLSVDKLPTNPVLVTRGDLDRDRAITITETLQRKNASVFVSEVAGNPFQPDFSYRGFSASPVPGTPQGLAVYQDGVRINEAFGDHVNFDLIPTVAINETNIVSGNPVFGLNALGGAMVMEMKNGFNYQGYEVDGRGGSYGRRFGSAQAGKQIGNFGAYAAFEAVGDDGWRYRSGSSLLRGFADLGYRAEGGEIHASYSGASSRLGAAAATPAELLQRDYRNVYTTPQTANNEMHFVNLRGAYQATSTVLLNANAYYRQFGQNHVDGNIADMETCSSKAFVCQDNDPFLGVVPSVTLRRLRDVFGNQIPASVLLGGLPASVDKTRTLSRSYGGTLQATVDEDLFGKKNKLVVGGALDRHNTGFQGWSELGVLTPSLSVASTGITYVNLVADGGFQSSSITSRNLYYGLYALDNLELTDKLTVTAGLRFNSAQISIYDRLGVRANSDALYQRVNPTAGLSYNFIPEFTVYGNYSEANRAPTPLENGCSDPNHPCLIDNFLVSDPPLKQVVTRTGEIGFRGHHDIGAEYGLAKGRLDYRVGLFRAVNSDDIFSLPSNVISGRGYYANVGATRRDGVEVETSWRNDRLSLYANYALINATFRSAVTVGSQNNPFADANGNIQVTPGNVMPGIPRHRVKLGFDYLITPQWKFGADYIYTSGVHLFGDEANLDRLLPGWGIVNIKTSYKVTDNVEVYAVAQNIGNQKYYTYGTYFDNSGNATASAPGFTNSRTLGPGAPVTVFGGVKVKF